MIKIFIVSILIALIGIVNAFAEVNAELVNTELKGITNKKVCKEVIEVTTCPSGSYPEICKEITAKNPTVISQVNEHCEKIKEPEAKGVIDILFDEFNFNGNGNGNELIASIIAALVAILTWIKIRFHRFKKATEHLITRLADPFYKNYESYDSRAINAVLIGEGGSGKTTLIRALTGASEASPDIGTDSISTYSLVHEVTVNQNNSKKRRIFRIYIDDYVGQQLIDCINDKTINERLEKIPAAFPIIVVDLFPKITGKEENKYKNIDQERVDEQLRIFHGNTIQLMLTRSVNTKDIVVFINKIDKLSNVSKNSYESARNAYSSLIEQLEDIRGKRVHVIVGSAQTGCGVVGYSDGNRERRSLLEVIHDVSSSDGIQNI